MRTAINPTKVIKKSMIGRPGDFLGFDGKIYNGVLKWEDVDEEYSFSFVYNGPYTRNIFELLPVDPLTNQALGGPKVMRDDEGDYFVGLKPHKDYEVIVSQDEGTAAAK